MITQNGGMSTAIREEFESFIPGRLLKNIDPSRVAQILEFGCGESSSPFVSARYFPDAQVTAYDTDKTKIDRMINKQIVRDLELVRYTSQKPVELFDAVFAFSILHHNPEQLIDEALGFLSENGYIAIIDYDMKNISQNEFFQRWGHVDVEYQEKQSLGTEKAYQMHTSLGLEDYLNLLRERNVKPIFYEGGLEALFSYGALPGKHFVCLGSKENTDSN